MTTHPDEARRVNEILLELFRAHGVVATRQGEGVAFPETGMKASASLIQEIKRPAILSVELEVRFEFVPGRTIIEAFAGIGATREAATAEAFQNFAANSFHVLLAAFLRAKDADDEQVAQQEWVIDGTKRRVTASSLGLRGKPPVPGAQLAAWHEELLRRLGQEPFGPQTHWVRAYYAQAQGQTLACEVLLDNKAWDEMGAEVSALGWPSEDFYSLRAFLVIEGEDQSSREASEVRAQPPSWQFWKR